MLLCGDPVQCSPVASPTHETLEKPEERPILEISNQGHPANRGKEGQGTRSSGSSCQTCNGTLPLPVCPKRKNNQENSENQLYRFSKGYLPSTRGWGKRAR